MSIAADPIAHKAIAEIGVAGAYKRPPAARRIVPKPDSRATPEAR